MLIASIAIPIRIWIAWKIVSKRYRKASSSGPNTEMNPFHTARIFSTMPWTIPEIVLLITDQMVDAVVEIFVQIPDKNDPIPETMPPIVSEIACQTDPASALRLSQRPLRKEPISVQCSLMTITRFATANTIAAMTPATTAGAPRMTAPTAAIAIPIPIKISFTTENPFVNISMKFFTAVTTPAITSPIPENALSTAPIPEVAAPMPFTAPVIPFTAPAIFGAIVMIVPTELMILPTKMRTGPSAATRSATTRMISFTGPGSLFKKSTNPCSMATSFRIAGIIRSAKEMASSCN